jgi:uncharacterized protein YciI
MKKLSGIFAVLLLVMAGTPGATVVAEQAPAAQSKIDEYKMTTYQAVFVTKGPAWTTESAEVQPLVRAHREYVAQLLRAGRVHIGGPFTGDADLRGVYFLSGTTEDAKALAEADPGVKAGRYGYELLKWMGPEGWFQKVSDIEETEKIYFGFLVSGSNTSPVTPEEQKQLMAGHLRYMDGQAKLGKLVLAGPLVNAGRRRGLIAYRMPTMAEAIERASGDPMIKAGRMAPELYEWTVPKGTLK